jgi:nucleoside-diphosphate-sugar epimerase
MNDGKVALVLGATGGIGGEVSRALAAAGWTVRGLNRDPLRIGKQAKEMAVAWIAGDAMRRDDVVAAAEGASLIVHAVNPPGYRNWSQLVLPMMDNTIAAARASGAGIVLPGTVYNYGSDAVSPIDEAAPQEATTRKGMIRIEMERRLQVAAADGVRTLVLRAGDFFGPRAANNWFSQGLVTPGKPVTSILDPAAPGVGHQWAYLPDVAETMLRLIERRRELPPFSTFHMDGHWDPDGTGMMGAIRRVLHRPDLKVRRLPWWLVSLASPVVPLCREMSEMRYLWRQPVRLDNRRLLTLLGREPRTPLDTAVRNTLQGIGCIAAEAA